MRVAVVGAGLGGLGVALRLQGAGHDVVVLEQRETSGGRAIASTSEYRPPSEYHTPSASWR